MSRSQGRHDARVRSDTRPKPGPSRRTPRPHDRVAGRARAGRPGPRPDAARRVERPKRTSEPRPILKTLTKLTARAVLGVVILAVFVFGVFPTGSYMEQRRELNRAIDELEALEAENQGLQERVSRLESDEEIERVAREQFGLGHPDEESYLILPPGG